MTPLTTELRVEFDQVNKVLLIRVEGQLTDESLGRLYAASQEYSTTTNARVTIVDLSSVIGFAVSSEFIHDLAGQTPAMGAAKRLYFIVAPGVYVFGLSRMFQILGEARRPLLQVVHTLGEAFAAIGTQSPSVEFSARPNTSANSVQ